MRPTVDLGMPVSSAMSRTVKPSSKRAFTLARLRSSIHSWSRRQPRPKLELGLEWLGLVAVDASRLLEVNLKPRTLFWRVVLRPPQQERGVEYVLAATGAALAAVLVGMVANTTEIPRRLSRSSHSWIGVRLSASLSRMIVVRLERLSRVRYSTPSSQGSSSS